MVRVESKGTEERRLPVLDAIMMDGLENAPSGCVPIQGTWIVLGGLEKDDTLAHDTMGPMN
jgi:hypothetical protein